MIKKQNLFRGPFDSLFKPMTCLVDLEPIPRFQLKIFQRRVRDKLDIMSSYYNDFLASPSALCHVPDHHGTCHLLVNTRVGTYHKRLTDGGLPLYCCNLALQQMSFLTQKLKHNEKSCSEKAVKYDPRDTKKLVYFKKSRYEFNDGYSFEYVM